MTSPFMCKTASASHVGKVREVNEDSLLARPEIGLWAVADGMGGHGGGDLASHAVVAALATIESPDSAADFLARFEDRIIRVNADLRALARSRGAQIVGSTVVAILIHGAHYACVWCGDSRAYLLRGGVLTQISRDHSEVQDLIDRGVLEPREAKRWPRRNVITRALGVADQAALEIGDGPIAVGDRFLLCSDGLTAHVDDSEIAALLGADEPHKVCARLISLTLQRGASDNVSIIVVACDYDTRTVRFDASWSAQAAAAADRSLGGDSGRSPGSPRRPAGSARGASTLARGLYCETMTPCAVS
jgi:serine/threonine protein phosphatase PrpC